MSDKNKTFRFEDHFSNHSNQYAQYRPRYPDEIYAYLASLAPGHSLSLGLWNRQRAGGNWTCQAFR